MRSLLLASVLIVLAAASAPSLVVRLLERPGATEAGPSVEQSRGDTARVALTPAGDKVQIKAERDGHFYVDAEINFRPVRLMVDTGASIVALRRSDAEAAGIRPRRSDFSTPVQTANGTTAAASIELDSVAVRGIELSAVRALVLPDEQLSVSLLGGSFLNRLARFEVSDRTLTFEN